MAALRTKASGERETPLDEGLKTCALATPAHEIARPSARLAESVVTCDSAEGTLEQCGKGDVTAKGTVAGVQAGCFPQLYAALAPDAPGFVITL